MTRPHYLLLIGVLSAAIVNSPESSRAGTHNWSGAVNGLWSNAGNWSSGGAPAVGEAVPVILNFPNTATRKNITNDIGSPLLGYLSVDAINLTGNNYVVSGKGGGVIFYLTGYFSFPSVLDNIYCTGLSNTFDSTLQIVLANANAFLVSSGNTLTFQSHFTGSGGIVFNGGNCLFNSPYTNTFTGALNVQSGNVYLDNFVAYFDQYDVPSDVDVPALGGPLIIGQTSNAVPANVYVQRSYQITSNSDVTINPTGTLLCDRSVLNTNLDFYTYVSTYMDFNGLDNDVRSLTLNGGTLYLGTGVFVTDYYHDTDSRTASLDIYSNFNSYLSPNPTTTSLIWGPGFLGLVNTNATIASDQLLFFANAGVFTKFGAGTLTLNGAAEVGNLTVAQGSCNIISSNVWVVNVTVSNGAQLNILQPCQPGGTLELHGRGTNGTGAALNVQSPGVIYDVDKMFVHDDTYINVGSGDQLTLEGYYLDSYIAGSSNLYKLGAGTLKFSDFAPNLEINVFTNPATILSNLFSGTLYVQGGTAEFNSADPIGSYPTDGGIALYGPIVIGTNGSVSSCYVQLDANGQLNTNVNITINDGCQLNILGTNTQTIGSLTLNGGAVALGNAVLYGDVTAKFATYQPLMVTTLSLGGTNRNFNVATNTTLSIYGPISDGGNNAGLTKIGPGELDLGASNSYGGLTLVNAGKLGLFNSGTPGSTNSGTVIAYGAELDLKDGVKVGQEALSVTGIGVNNSGVFKATGTNSWDGPITMITNGMVIDVATNSLTILNGPLFGTNGAITKANFGTLEFAGSSPNAYPGATWVQVGTLWLAKTNNATAVPGPLVVGISNNPSNSVIAKLLQPGQLSPTGAVTLNYDGFLDLNSVTSSAAGSLSGSGGLAVGFGQFTVGGDNTSTAYSGSINGLGASLVKTGTGAWTVSGVSSMFGQTLVGGGTLLVDGYLGNASCTVSNSATLGGNGTVGALTALSGSTISPGHSPGLLNSGTLTFNPGAIFLVQINGTNVSTGYDQLNVSGSVAVSNATLQVAMTIMGAPGAQYTIVNNDSIDAVTGTFLGLAEGATVIANNGVHFTISYHGGSGNDIVLTQTTVAPPQLSGITRLANGSIMLTGAGQPSTTYFVLASTNLATPTTNWLNLGPITADSLGALSFTDAQTSSNRARFYRIVYP